MTTESRISPELGATWKKKLAQSPTQILVLYWIWPDTKLNKNIKQNTKLTNKTKERTSIELPIFKTFTDTIKLRVHILEENCKTRPEI